VDGLGGAGIDGLGGAGIDGLGGAGIDGLGGGTEGLGGGGPAGLGGRELDRAEGEQDTAGGSAVLPPVVCISPTPVLLSSPALPSALSLLAAGGFSASWPGGPIANRNK